MLTRWDFTNQFCHLLWKLDFELTGLFKWNPIRASFAKRNRCHCTQFPLILRTGIPPTCQPWITSAKNSLGHCCNHCHRPDIQSKTMFLQRFVVGDNISTRAYGFYLNHHTLQVANKVKNVQDGLYTLSHLSFDKLHLQFLCTWGRNSNSPSGDGIQCEHVNIYKYYIPHIYTK
jgi:hypothetical protein